MLKTNDLEQFHKVNYKPLDRCLQESGWDQELRRDAIQDFYLDWLQNPDIPKKAMRGNYDSYVMKIAGCHATSIWRKEHPILHKVRHNLMSYDEQEQDADEEDTTPMAVDRHDRYSNFGADGTSMIDYNLAKQEFLDWCHVKENSFERGILPDPANSMEKAIEDIETGWEGATGGSNASVRRFRRYRDWYRQEVLEKEF